MPRPIDADALYDALRDNEFQTFCPLDEVDDVIAAAPTLDYEPVRHVEWISVEMDIPAEDTPVLVFVDPLEDASFVSTDILANGEWLKYPLDITHWMPLPEPPKEN